MLLSVFGNTLWSAYAHKLDNMDMMIPNSFGKGVFCYNQCVLAWFVSLILMVMYITVDCDMKQAFKGFCVAFFAAASFSEWLPCQLCGLTATTMSIMTSLSTLEQVPLVV